MESVMTNTAGTATGNTQDGATGATTETTATEAGDSTATVETDAAQELGKGGETALQRERENAREATKLANMERSQKQALLKELAAMIGAEDEEVTAEQATTQLAEKVKLAEEAATRASAAELKLAIFMHGGEADVEAFMDSSSAMAAMGEVDPTDSDAVKAKIAEILEKSPRLRGKAAASVDTQSGQDGANSQMTPSQALRFLARNHNNS